jgi:YugN-like family
LGKLINNDEKGGCMMIEIPSSVEGKQVDLYKLEQMLKPIGYSIGGNWDYDHGAFDYKINDEVGYQFLRLPFSAIDGQLDAHNCRVALGRPFLLSHKYQIGLDDHISAGTLNQFSEPVDKDASFPEQYIETGKVLVKELESILSSEQLS